MPNVVVSANVDTLLRSDNYQEFSANLHNADPVIYAADYGVVADYNPTTFAGTDDTAALQAALNAAAAASKSQVVMLPAGNMKITAELVVANRVTLRGHGFAKSLIWATTAGQNGIWINSALHDNCKFQDFALYGPSGHGGDGVATGVGILCDDKVAPGTYVFGPTEFDGVWVSRWSTCLKLGQMPLTVAKQCYFGGFRVHGIHLVSTDTFQFNACASGYGTEPVDHTVGSPTTIKIEGSAVDPTGTNFSGEFTNCEFGDTWKFLTITGCRAGFESCNFETRGGVSGHVTADTLFDIAPGSRLYFKNCRTGWGSTAADSSATPRAAVLCDCSNNSAEPRLIVDNTDLAGGLYVLGAKYVGANWGFYNPSVVGNTQLVVKYYNASNVEQANMPTAASMWFSRGHDWFASNVLSSAWAALRRSQVYLYFVGGGDSTRGDDNLIYVRKTRKFSGGVLQFTRSSLSNDSLMEVLATSITSVSNDSASAKVLTTPTHTLLSGTLVGNGDKIVFHARGTCAANANVKTLSIGLNGAAYAPTSLTITDATAVYWEYVAEVYGNDVGVGSAARIVVTLTAFDSTGLQLHCKKLNTTAAGFTADTLFSVMGQSATASDVTCLGWDLVWRANATKV